MKHKTTEHKGHHTVALQGLQITYYPHEQVPTASDSVASNRALKTFSGTRLLSFHFNCRLFQDSGAAHLNAIFPKTVLAVGTFNKTTACDLRQ